VITAVDTNVLLDVFGADAKFGQASRDAVGLCLAQGSLIACDVVWAETTSFFPSARAGEAALEVLGVAFEPLPREAALAAGAAWKNYRSRRGRRDRVVADFLIGAHAIRQAERLLTRDQGFYRSYFPRLKILDPAGPQRP
jgi:predicted nucleic acid-binding protein